MRKEFENQLQTIKHEVFGEIRAINIDDKEYFVANDVAKTLGYKNTSKAIKDHCKGVTKRYIPTNGGSQEINLIPIADVLRLCTKSKLPSAQEFESWVFDEVLPTKANLRDNVPADKLDLISKAENAMITFLQAGITEYEQLKNMMTMWYGNTVIK